MNKGKVIKQLAKDGQPMRQYYLQDDSREAKGEKSKWNEGLGINYIWAVMLVGLMGALALIYPELASAVARFDIDGGVAAATNPLIKALEDHWGKGVLLAGGGAALFGEGDGRQRAVRAAVAGGIASAVVLGFLAALK